jgi:hypothetical protein
VKANTPVYMGFHLSKWVVRLSVTSSAADPNLTLMMVFSRQVVRPFWPSLNHSSFATASRGGLSDSSSRSVGRSAASFGVRLTTASFGFAVSFGVAASFGIVGLSAAL